MKSQFIWSHFFSGLLGAIFGCLVGATTVYFVILSEPVVKRDSLNPSKQTLAPIENETEIKAPVQLKNSNLFIVACAKDIKSFCEKLDQKPEVLRKCLTQVKSRLSKSCQQFI